MIQRYIGQAVRQAREQAGLTQEQIMEKIRRNRSRRISTYYLSAVESHRSDATIEKLEDLCGAIGCKMSYVIRIAEELQEKALEQKRLLQKST